METPHGRRTRPAQPGRRPPPSEETPVGAGGAHSRRGQAATRGAQGSHGVDRNARTRTRACARAGPDSGHQHSASSSSCPCPGPVCIPARRHERHPPSATWIRAPSRNRPSPRRHAVPAAWVPDAPSSRVRLVSPIGPVSESESSDTDSHPFCPATVLASRLEFRLLLACPCRPGEQAALAPVRRQPGDTD
jgi:hypothetical protein